MSETDDNIPRSLHSIEREIFKEISHLDKQVGTLNERTQKFSIELNTFMTKVEFAPYKVLIICVTGSIVTAIVTSVLSFVLRKG